MSKCTTEVALRGIFTALVAVALQTSVFAQEQPRLATFDDDAGSTHFALSVSPQDAESVARPSDVLIYVDTSASQSGAYKRDSIAAVKQILRNLNADDRVKISAVDLDPVALVNDFVSPASADVAGAIKSLNQRVALGTTDVGSMLDQASTAFSDPSRNKNVIYIGDGISADKLMLTPAFETTLTKLIDNRVSVSSFGIGPERNVELMAALANHTGGNVLLDSDAEGAIREASAGLAKTVHGSVLWPTDGKLDPSVSEMYPKRFPPLRTDRDTIVLGKLADRDEIELSVTGELNGKSVTYDWKIAPEASDKSFAFLPGMIKDASKDSGLRLPTVGSDGLKEFARVRQEKAMHLSDLTQKALVAGDMTAAERLGQGALGVSSNPAGLRVALKAMAPMYKVQENLFGDAEPAADAFQEEAAIPQGLDDPFKEADTLESAAPMVDSPVEELPAAVQEGVILDVPSVIENTQGDQGLILIGEDDSAEVQQLLRSRDGRDLKMVQGEEDLRRVVNERARAKTRFEISRASEELGTNPDLAIERLKSTLETINLAGDLFPSTRAELRAKLQSSLQSARRQKLEYDQRLAIRDQNVTLSQQLAESSLRREREEARLETLLGRFNSLLREGNYETAVEVTRAARELAPRNPEVVAAAELSMMARNYRSARQLQQVREEAFVYSLFQATRAATPYPSDALMLFPDADEWREKRIRRKKYQNFRLSGSAIDEKILNALDLPAEFNYDETSWTEVKEELEDKYNINIVLTTSAQDDSLPEDETFTSNLQGIRLKNALRILLAEKNATFVVKDEVLQIISLDEASDQRWFTTDVYNVADLVAPRQNRGGGGIGGQGGGQGGFGGGQGGGQGGFGGGQGGGQFCIQQDALNVKFNAGPAESAKESSTRKRPTTVNLTASGAPVVAWSDYFSDQFVDPANVRLTARKLMKQQQPKQVVEMILAAIDNDQMQSWMYEALVLAMQVAGEDQLEIERALMSSVDLSGKPDDVLLVANYMAENGMESRSLKLLKAFAAANPSRFEPYVLGLKTAQRTQDLDAMMWATVGVFEQEWPSHPEMVRKAGFVAEGIVAKLKKEGKTDRLAAFENQMQQAQERDCVIDVSWTGDADLDLQVNEPGGTICSSLQPRTSSGGVMLGDKFSPEKNHSGTITERYVLPKGFAGDYQLVVKRVWGDITSGKATVSIRNHYKSDRESGMTRQVKLDKIGAIVLFSLDKGRRTENLADHEIRTFAKEQMVRNRSILAQQISDSYSSSAASDYYQGQAGNDGQFDGDPRNLLNSNLRRGRVGYQPQITTIPEGTFMTASASTADRLFVLTSVTPNFSQITEVSTFNILGTAEDAQGVTQNLGGSGVGGAGGAGGGVGGNVGGGGGGVGGGVGGGGFGN